MAVHRRGRRKKRKNASKVNKKLIYGIAGGSVGAVALAYIGVSLYFTAHFLPNTEINGHECSGKTVSQVEDVFKEEMKEYSLTVYDKDGQKEEITSEEISLEYKESKDMKNALKEQNPFLWPMAMFFEETGEVTIDLSYNTDQLDQRIQSLKAVTVEQLPPESARPEFDGTQFVVRPEVYGTAVNQDALKEKISKAIRELKPAINLKDEKCYQEPEFTSKSSEVLQARDELNQYCKANITYSMDEPVVVDGSVISTWLSLDEEMKVTLDEGAMKKWLEEFGDKYDTMEAERTFTTPTGKQAAVSGGDYGWSIDEDTEFAALKEAVMNGETVTKEPAYYVGGTAASHGMPDWGTTFAEVDITEQHMWYVVDGSVVLETDVVTGEPIPERATPTGVYVFKEKALNATLVGEIDPSTGEPSYRTPVDYWMRITWSGIGFHDADWQTAFGGELYKIHNIGSHGCVNMPVDKAAELYNMIEVGVPVIIHY